MVLGVVEGKVYYGYVEEHSQRQGHLGKSSVDMTRLQEGDQLQQPGGPKVQKEWTTEMVRVYREGQPRPWRRLG